MNQSCGPVQLSSRLPQHFRGRINAQQAAWRRVFQDLQPPPGAATQVDHVHSLCYGNHGLQIALFQRQHWIRIGVVTAGPASIPLAGRKTWSYGSAGHNVSPAALEAFLFWFAQSDELLRQAKLLGECIESRCISPGAERLQQGTAPAG